MTVQSTYGKMDVLDIRKRIQLKYLMEAFPRESI